MKEREYERIYELINDNDLNYDDNAELEIEKLRGMISSGDCMYCGAKNAMKYEGKICFICSECKNSAHENIYYRWIAGYPIETDDYDEYYDEESEYDE